MSIPSVIPPSLVPPSSATVIQGVEFHANGQFAVACERARSLSAEANHWLVLERSPTMTLEERPESGDNVFAMSGEWMRVPQTFPSHDDAVAFVNTRRGLGEAQPNAVAATPKA